jgi:hypothetical protein
VESRTVGCGVIRAEGSAPSLWLGMLQTVARLISYGWLRMNELVSKVVGTDSCSCAGCSSWKLGMHVGNMADEVYDASLLFGRRLCAPCKGAIVNPKAVDTLGLQAQGTHVWA